MIQKGFKILQMASSNPKLTKDEKKELALLVAGGRISARTAERAVGLRGDGSSLLYYVKTVWSGVDLTPPGVKALLEQYEKKWKARFPAISGISAPMPMSESEPSGPTPIVPNLSEHSKKKSKVKRAAQLSAVEFYKRMNQGNTSMSWKDACAMTLAAFQKKKYEIKTLSPRKTSKFATMSNPEVAPHSGRQTTIPNELEKELAFIVRYLRDKNFPVHKSFIKGWMDESLAALGSANPFPQGVTDKWYHGWMKRWDMASGNETPLDQRRATWMTSDNLFQAFFNLFDVVVKYGYAKKNPEFTSIKDTPNVNPIIWNKNKLWRIMEFDECGLELGIRVDSAAKTSTERVITPKGRKSPVLREGVPQHHISAMMAINLAKETLLSGFVFDLGDNAHLKTEYLTDDEGNLLRIPLTKPDGSMTEHVPAFVASNDKGSFDSDVLISYMGTMTDHLQRLHEKRFTVEEPGILFIDGCQTHLTQKVIEWCVRNNIQLVIKLPYGTSKTQSMDVKGGHFQMLQQKYRKNLRIRTAQLVAALIAAKGPEGRKSGMAAQNGSLKMCDFIPCIKQPWLDICTRRRHEISLRTAGLDPPTMKPAYEQLEDDKVKAARVKDSERALGEQQISDASKALNNAVVKLLTGGKRKRGDSATAGGDDTAGVTAAVAGSVARQPATAQEAGDFAAREIVQRSDVDPKEKRKVYSMVRKNGGKWTRGRSGSVWANFRGHPTSPAYLMYTDAMNAYDMAIQQFHRRKRARATEKLRKQEAAELPVADAAHKQMKDKLWSSEFAKSLNRAALIALARVHAGLKDELTVNGSGKSKRVLLEMLEDYFTRMRATLPRLQRVTAGVGALRLVEEV